MLFILKRGRVPVFRLSADGRALTIAIITPGTFFGEIVLLGQHMYDCQSLGTGSRKDSVAPAVTV